jgi:uncharacterized membrane protein
MSETGGQDRAAELGQRLGRLQMQLDAQRDEIATLRAQLWDLQRAAPASESFAPPPPPEPSFVSPPVPPATRPQPSQQPPPQSPVRPVPAAIPPPVAAPVPPKTPIATPSFAAYAPPATDAKPEVHRSLENRIGSQFFNRIGIVAVFIGVALFLKLAYDTHRIHITPTGRISAVLIAGAGVIGWSEYLRRKGYTVFSYSMKAIGTGTLYMALWASFHLYHVLPPSVALAAMILVTAWNAVMAWMQDAELLAVYALVGGFATPVLVGSGGNHEIFLFSYILAMDVAVLLLLTKKPWHRLLLGSFPGTVTYFIGWYTKFFTPDQAGTTGLFVILLATPFAAVPLIGKQREDAGEGLLAPLVAASFLSLGLYSVLQDSGHHAWLPWGAVALAAVYLLLMRLRRNGIAEAVQLAIAIIFLTIAIPLKAEGRWITIGWLAEGVALLWVAAKLLGPEVQARVRGLMRWLGCIALALGVGQSLIFWAQESAQNAFWNARFWTEMSAVAALALAAWLARHPAREDAADPGLNAPSWTVVSTISSLASHLVAALSVARELAAYWSVGLPVDAAYRQELSAFSIASFLMVYAACLIAWLAFKRGKRSSETQQTLLGWIAMTYLALGFLAMVLTPTIGDGNPERVFWNERFIFQLCGVAGLSLVAWFARLARRSNETPQAPRNLSWPLLDVQTTLGAHLLAALAGAREISPYWTGGNVQVSTYNDQLHAISIAAFLMVYGACLIAWVALREKGDESPGQRTTLRVLGCIYLSLGSLAMIVTPIVGDGGPVNVFWNARLLLEMVGATALAATAWLAWRAYRIRKIATEEWAPIAVVSLLVFNLLVVLTGVHEIFTFFGVRATGDAGLAESFSISAWLMLYAAVLLAAGFWKRTAFVRWQGLGLLVFTIAKVFLYDMHNLSSGYRILSILGLGALLMAVSFVYQKDWLKLREGDAAPASDEAAS